MSGNRYEFIGVWSGEMTAYLKLREAQGHKHLKERSYLVSLDKYLVSQNLWKKTLTAYIVEGWIQSLSIEKSVNTKIVYISHYSQFAKYLSTLSFAAFIPECPIDDKSYSPYVFSEQEIERMFVVADDICSGGSRLEFGSLEFPLIMWILYGCGLRLNEALGLKISDVDMVCNKICFSSFDIAIYTPA